VKVFFWKAVTLAEFGCPIPNIRGIVNRPVNNLVPMETSENQAGASGPAGKKKESVVVVASGSLKTITALLSIVVIVCFAILGGALFNAFHPPQPPPNKELIKYLEQERQEIVKSRQAIEKVAADNMTAAIDRQLRDSLTDMKTQARLLQSLDNFRPLYEKNKYVFDLGATQLRREYTDFKP
jgi:hypothetical protein